VFWRLSALLICLVFANALPSQARENGTFLDVAAVWLVAVVTQFFPLRSREELITVGDKRYRRKKRIAS